MGKKPLEKPRARNGSHRAEKPSTTASYFLSLKLANARCCADEQTLDLLPHAALGLHALEDVRRVTGDERRARLAQSGGRPPDVGQRLRGHVRAPVRAEEHSDGL